MGFPERCIRAQEELQAESKSCVLYICHIGATVQELKECYPTASGFSSRVFSLAKFLPKLSRSLLTLGGFNPSFLSIQRIFLIVLQPDSVCTWRIILFCYENQICICMIYIYIFIYKIYKYIKYIFIYFDLVDVCSKCSHLACRSFLEINYVEDAELPLVPVSPSGGWICAGFPGMSKPLVDTDTCTRSGWNSRPLLGLRLILEMFWKSDYG